MFSLNHEFSLNHKPSPWVFPCSLHTVMDCLYLSFLSLPFSRFLIQYPLVIWRNDWIRYKAHHISHRMKVCQWLFCLRSKCESRARVECSGRHAPCVHLAQVPIFSAVENQPKQIGMSHRTRLDVSNDFQGTVLAPSSLSSTFSVTFFGLWIVWLVHYSRKLLFTLSRVGDPFVVSSVPSVYLP